MDNLEYNKEQLINRLKEVLNEERFRHTLGVSDTAVKLAAIYGCDVQKAEIAGLMHDCAKCIDKEQSFKICAEYGVELSEIEIKNPALIHAKLGAIVAKNDYGITDNEILSAIRFHTTGKPNMTLLEKIIYISDYIEPGRTSIPDIENIRKTCFEDLNKGLVTILGSSLTYIKEKGFLLDPQTLETYNFYVKEEQNG